MDTKMSDFPWEKFEDITNRYLAEANFFTIYRNNANAHEFFAERAPKPPLAVNKVYKGRQNKAHKANQLLFISIVWQFLNREPTVYKYHKQKETQSVDGDNEQVYSKSTESFYHCIGSPIL